MPNNKNMKLVPKPVNGYKLKVNGETYHYVANQDGWQHEHQPFLNLEPNAMVLDWELIPIVHELEWVDGNEFPLPMPEVGLGLLIRAKDGSKELLMAELDEYDKLVWESMIAENLVGGELLGWQWFLFKA
jgi:hypothetical protein